jgi:hypothetical protein
MFRKDVVYRRDVLEELLVVIPEPGDRSISVTKHVLDFSLYGWNATESLGQTCPET